MNDSSLNLLIAPAILTLGASLLAIVGALTSARNRSATMRPAIGFLAMIFLVLACWALVLWPKIFTPDKLTADPLAFYTALIAIAGSILAVLVAFGQPPDEYSGEFFSMVLFMAAGVLLIGPAHDLLILFLAIELTSIPAYVLVALSRRGPMAEEASGKYFFMGALATAIIAYGFVFLYGAARSMVLDPDYFSRLLAHHPNVMTQWLAAVGLIIAFAGLAFKTTTIPYYFYVPDVYQGCGSGATAIIAFLPKVAGFIALLKVLAWVGFNNPVWHIFWPILWIVAAGTATAGNVLGLLQHNVKRMLAYSSIAHSGYMLIGIAAVGGIGGGMQNGLAAVLFYILIYALMSVGAFGVIGYLAYLQKGAAPGDEPARLADLAGLAGYRGGTALMLTIFVFSLTGLPPTAGFWAKVYIFSAAMSSRQFWLIVLTVIGLINAAIAAAYYMRIINWVYLRPAESEPTDVTIGRDNIKTILPMGLILIALTVLIFGIVPGRLMQLCETAARVLLPG